MSEAGARHSKAFGFRKDYRPCLRLHPSVRNWKTSSFPLVRARGRHKDTKKAFRDEILPGRSLLSRSLYLQEPCCLQRSTGGRWREAPAFSEAFERFQAVREGTKGSGAALSTSSRWPTCRERELIQQEVVAVRSSTNFASHITGAFRLPKS